MLTIKLDEISLKEYHKRNIQELHYFKKIKKDIYLSIVKFNKDYYGGRWEAFSNNKLFNDILIDDSLVGILKQLREKYDILALI